ncbi:MAG: hypothetical protein AAB923_02020, partial [Patescibacteria group bacterium]
RNVEPQERRQRADDDGDESYGRGDEHKSAVAKAVASLIAAADRDGGIGEEVREIAMEQQAVHEEVAEGMEKVETRNPLITFLFGTDYKTLGALRSSLVTSQNGIDRLMAARDRATDPAVQVELDVEIQALEEENAHAETFIEENESKFSLLGWLVKFFSE